MAADIRVSPVSSAEDAAVKSSQRWVQRALQFGLLFSIVLMASGLLLHLLSGSVSVLPIPLFELSQFILPDQLITCGVLVLALTPVVRVFTLLLLWSRQKDWRFAGIAAVVLCVLVVSVLLGHRH